MPITSVDMWQIFAHLIIVKFLVLSPLVKPRERWSDLLGATSLIRLLQSLSLSPRSELFHCSQVSGLQLTKTLSRNIHSLSPAFVQWAYGATCPFTLHKAPPTHSFQKHLLSDYYGPSDGATTMKKINVEFLASMPPIPIDRLILVGGKEGISIWCNVL